MLLRLLAGIPDLLDDEEVALAADNALEAAVFVARHHDEALAFPAYGLVLRASEQQDPTRSATGDDKAGDAGQAARVAATPGCTRSRIRR